VIPAVDTSFLTTGGEWQIGGAQAPAGTPGAGSFGSMLGQQIGKLTDLQTDAASASQALATGQATDPTSVVMSVEKAQLAMQLAGQLRTKGVEAVQEILHTSV
jgi:flagellar hook-basal body complex protein FliE